MKTSEQDSGAVAYRLIELVREDREQIINLLTAAISSMTFSTYGFLLIHELKLRVDATLKEPEEDTDSSTTERLKNLLWILTGEERYK